LNVLAVDKTMTRKQNQDFAYTGHARATPTTSY